MKQAPQNLPVALALGRAMILASRPKEGLDVLSDALTRHPDSPEAWDAWLSGLDDAGRPDELVKEFARLPASLSADPRFSKHRGMAARNSGDHAGAVEAFRRACEADPGDGVTLYRLSRAMRLAGDPAERARAGGQLRDQQPGRDVHPGLHYLRGDEARAWETVAKGDPASRAAGVPGPEGVESP